MRPVCTPSGASTVLVSGFWTRRRHGHLQAGVREARLRPVRQHPLQCQVEIPKEVGPDHEPGQSTIKYQDNFLSHETGLPGEIYNKETIHHSLKQ